MIASNNGLFDITINPFYKIGSLDTSIIPKFGGVISIEIPLWYPGGTPSVFNSANNLVTTCSSSNIIASNGIDQ